MEHDMKDVLYQGAATGFQEVPDEVSLIFSIAGCTRQCPGCHSSHLWKHEGRPLYLDYRYMLDKYQGYATCVCFMGEGLDAEALKPFMLYAKARGFRTCLYTGADTLNEFSPEILLLLDYIKIGHYDEKLGGLASPVTNQAMYHISWENDELTLSKVHFMKKAV